MNPSQDFSPEVQTTTDPSSGPGRRLRELRESRGIEIERVIAQLHLQRDIVEALEQDRYEGLPPPVFVAGYLKSYARLLGTDPEPIVSAYRSTIPGDDHRTTQPKTAPRKGRFSNAWIWILLLAVIGGGAAGGYFWWQGQGTQAPEGLEPTADTSAPNGSDGNATISADTADAADGVSEEEPNDSATKAPPDAIPLRSQEPAPQPEPAVPQETSEQATDTAPPEEPASETPEQESEPEEPIGPPQVALEFTGTTWIDVRDAQGKVVLNGEMREGDRRVLTGEPPYKLVIGNAAATRMTVGGEDFDVQRRARGNVARFSLDPEAPQ
ncbi:RodZ domain-containing protein [Imhoffiella purpurea]|uniref:Putative membrane protein n=1 Tax=Imhoffiella purpurea TaxID=1249627 RepID=W9V513_9GAMM|nr:RodZ domain-containing protein [Imhoffiella purpurea]EXJ14643.1 putative membrane protein [Imhoffiella purpurea]